MSRRPAAALAWLLAALLPLMAAPAAADERILAYDSVLEVRADGSIDVTEHIRVRAEGDAIRRGIYRSFPTHYKDRHGNRVVVGFEMLGVERDGHPEPWFTEGRSNGVRINTGNDDFLPVPLETTYTLRFRTTRQIGFFNAHDELYWNAIGHGWDFAIGSGSVEVRLPAPVPVEAMAVEGYSGGYGARGQDFEARVTAPGVARWTLAHPLQPGEGLTIVLSFPKGIVAAPTQAQGLLWLLRDNLSLLAALGGLGALLVFCLGRWRRVGRDPRPGVVIARYGPPASESSPAALRYMVRRGYDSTCMSAELLACAVHGAVGIIRDERRVSSDRWTLERRDPPDPGAVTMDERRLLDRLLPPSRPRLELEKGNAAHIQAAVAEHSRMLAARFKPSMFTLNGGSIAFAFAIFGVTLVVTLVLAAGSNGGGMPWALVPLGLGLAAAVWFTIVIGAPTPKGRRLLDEIEGFKRYLSVAEQDDLARLAQPDAAGPPPLDAARFEAMLPYAVALDVEDAWTAKFTAAVGASAAAAAVSGISWYQGRGSTDIGQFTRSVGSALDSRIASSSTPPGSSSGSGGGGFSGGGGGGGGGGGR